MAVALPAVALLDILWGLLLIAVAWAGYQLFIWSLEQLGALLGPLAPGVADWAQGVGNTISNTAFGAVQGLIDPINQAIKAPAATLSAVFTQQANTVAALYNALARTYSHVNWAVTALGAWPGGASVYSLANGAWSQAVALTTAFNNAVGTYNAAIATLQGEISGLSTSLGATVSALVAAALAPLISQVNALVATVNADMAALYSAVNQASAVASQAEADAASLSRAAEVAAEQYAYSGLTSLEASLTAWVEQELAAQSSSLLDHVSAVTSALQAEIGGVSDELRRDVAALAAQAAQEDAALSAELKSAITQAAATAASEIGSLSSATRASIADISLRISAGEATLSNTLTGDVARLSAEIMTSEGALSADLIGRIGTVADQAQAARSALGATLTAAIGSNASAISRVASNVATMEQECVDPLCQSFGKSAGGLADLIDAAEQGVFWGILALAISDPKGTGQLFESAAETFAEPIYRDVAGLF